jgi:leader peptidase (prepilin peptidase) / N-methyltransferase
MMMSAGAAPSAWLSWAPLPAAVLFALGLCFGSFLNVVIHRLPLGLSLVRPRSRCPRCETPIRARHNVPLVAWVWLRGRCASCGAPIPARYPLVELAGGVFALLAGFAFPSPVATVAAFWFFLALLAVLFIDYDHRIIPDEISLGGTALGLALSHWTVGWAASAAGLAAGAGALFLVGWIYQRVRGRPGMGLGDVKLAAMLGAFLGPLGLLLTVLLASLLGSVAGITLILRRRGTGATALPFGSFLAPAGMVALLWGGRIWSWYLGAFAQR